MSGQTEKKAEQTWKPSAGPEPYVLEDQIGFILRRVNQRHTGIFADHIGESLTPTQFAALVKLHQMGSCTQNRLGRNTAMDAATIKGVIDRLTRRRLTLTWPDPQDRRRVLVGLTAAGLKVVEKPCPGRGKSPNARWPPWTKKTARP